jgi:hypothetical protein
MSLFSETSEQSTPKLFPTPSATSYGSNQGGGMGRVGPIRYSLNTMATTGRLTSSAAASPARTSVSPERARVSKAAAAAYGRSTPELLAKYDRVTSSWRTSQLCFTGELSEFSETWPRSGLVVAGTVSLPVQLERRTDETESGS